MLVRDEKVCCLAYYEKLSLFVLFQCKWCHSIHLKLNNRSDTSSVYHAAAVSAITKDLSTHRTLSRVSGDHTDSEDEIRDFVFQSARVR